MTLMVQIFLLISNQNSPCHDLSPLPPVMSLCTSENITGTSGSIYAVSSDQVVVESKHRLSTVTKAKFFLFASDFSLTGRKY